jgi:hypothetical protein
MCTVAVMSGSAMPRYKTCCCGVIVCYCTLSRVPPLQEKLAHVAATVGKIGASVAATCFIALLIQWCVVNRGFPLSKINDHGPVQFFLYSVVSRQHQRLSR